MSGRSRALLVTRNLPPLRGGMERLVLRIAQALAERHALSVVGPAGCGAHLPPGAEVREAPAKPLPRFLATAARATRALAKRSPPDFVLAGSGLTAPLAWWAARRARAPLVVYLHGLDIVAPSWIYQALWLPFIRRARLVLVNSDNTRRLAMGRGVPADALRILHPGTTLPGTDPHARDAFREAQALGDRPLLLSVGRFTPRKGLAEFIRRGLPDVLARHPDTLLLVIGADAMDAVQAAAGSEQARILASAAEAGVSDAVRLMPPCDDETLAAAYRAADVHVFPVLDLPGDVEGFGMVAIEAAAHGLPTVGFRVGGVPDAIIDGSSGSLIMAGRYTEFAGQVNAWLGQRKDAAVRANCIASARQFGWDRFGERLHALLAELPGRSP